MPCQFTRRIPEITDNLVSLYSESTATDKTLGRAWYPNARLIVAEWSATYNLSGETVACVIAALSPQNAWDRNVIQAGDILAGRPVSIGGIRANIDKAQRILYDKATSTLEYFPQGPKVASFALNLAGNDTAVTVDTHAMQAGLRDVQSTYTLPWQPYMCFASAYERAADRLSLPAAMFQAIIWHTWKRLYPPAAKRNARRQWDVIGEC